MPARHFRRALSALTVIIFVSLFLLAADTAPIPPVAAPTPGPPASAPLAIVSMGDSTISGEGAGDYAPATDGPHGDWCHRSNLAEVNETKLTGVTVAVNLACSGADSPAVQLGHAVHYTEPSQAAQLAPIAARDRVVAIVVSLGANDDPHFAQVVTGCVDAYLADNTAGCSHNFTPQWQQRVNAMIPKVTKALTDIRAVMTRAGYTPGSYQLVLQSYAAPIGPDIAPGLRGLAGCPFQPADLQWVRNTAVTVLDDGLAKAASAADTRFLDLAKAGIGHEACSGGNDVHSEWFTRLAVAWQDLHDAQRAGHALQSSFHPNARGQAAFANCLSQFLATTTDAAACLPGSDATLHPAAILPATG